MKHFLKKYFHLIFFILVSLIANFYLLINRGIPFRYDWNWPVFTPNSIWQFLSSNDNSVIGFLTKNASLLLASMGTVTVSSEVFLRILLFLVSFVSGYGAYIFISKQKISEPIKIIFGVIYALSPYVFIRTIVGFLWSLIAYALIPIFLNIYINNRQKCIYHYAILGFLMSIISAQIQAGLLILLILTIYLVLSLFNKKKRLNEIKSFVLTYLFFILFTLPWYVNSLLHRVNVEIVSGNSATTIGYMSLVPHSLRNMLMLSDHQITSSYFYQLSHNNLFLAGWIIVWLVAFCAIFARTNKKLVWTLIISCVLVSPFIEGPVGPLGKFYVWFYNHVPQIAVFRETYHFELLYTIALTILFAFGLDWLWLKIENFTEIKKSAIFSALKIGAKSFFAGSALIIILPYFTLNFAGYLKLQVIPAEYRKLYNFLQEDKNYCQKIYYPPGLGFIYFNGDTFPDASNTDIIAYSLGEPYLDDGTTFSYLPSEEKFYRNELVSQFYEPVDSGEFAFLLKQGGIDCVVTKLDTDTKYWLASNLGKENDSEVNKKWRNTDYLALIESKKGLELQKQFGKNIGIYKLDQQNRISDEEYKQKIEQSVGKNTAEQFDGAKTLQFPLIEWATSAAYYKDGWSRGRYDFWRKHLFTELRQDFAYTDRSSSQITGKVVGSGSCSLMARYLDGGQPGSFEINIDGQKLIATKNPGNEKFIWKNLGQLNISAGNTTITNISGENAIADIVCLQ